MEPSSASSGKFTDDNRSIVKIMRLLTVGSHHKRASEGLLGPDSFGLMLRSTSNDQRAFCQCSVNTQYQPSKDFAGGLEMLPAR